LTTSNRNPLLITLVYYGAFVSTGLMASVLGPTLPDLAKLTHTTLAEISVLFTAQSIGNMLGAVLVGRLFDRLSAHILMVIALVIMAAMLASVPLLSSLGLMIVVFWVLGLSRSAIDLGGNTLLVWVHGAKLGPYMNGLHFAYGAGAFLAPIIIAQAVDWTGEITLGYWILAVLMLPMVFFLISLPTPKAIETISEDIPPEVNYQLVFMIAVFFFLHVGAQASFGGWIFTYATDLNLADEKTARFMTSAYWGAITVGRLLAVPIAARFSSQTILLWDLLSMLGFTLLLAVAAHPVVLWIGILGAGLSVASLFPTTLAFAERRMKFTGNVTGWFMVGASLGGMTLPWIIGNLFEVAGAKVMIALIAADLIMSLGIYALLRTRFPARATTVYADAGNIA
jgi:FHS family Na+ dependent glucose MFS transporter 1